MADDLFKKLPGSVSSDETGYVNYDRHGLGAVVERKYNASVDRAINGFGSGAKQVATSNFGKAALITAAVVLASAALLFGFGASVGEITFSGGNAASFGQGIMLGLSKAAQFLLHPIGWITLGLGGFFGNKLLGRQEGKLTTEEAERQRIQHALNRTREQQQQVETSDPESQPQVQQAAPAQHASHQQQEKQHTPEPHAPHPQQATPAQHTPHQQQTQQTAPVQHAPHQQQAQRGSYVADELHRRNTATQQRTNLLQPAQL